MDRRVENDLDDEGMVNVGVLEWEAMSARLLGRFDCLPCEAFDLCLDVVVVLSLRRVRCIYCV